MVEYWRLVLQSLVGKAWNLIFPATASVPTPVDSPCFDSPCFMSSLRSSSCWKIFDSSRNKFCYLNFPELMDAEVWFSKGGWLLMSRDKCPLFFFNPFTREKFELPLHPSSLLSVCFTSPPTSSDCIIFGVLGSSTTAKTRFVRIKFGERQWKSCWFKNREHKFWPSNRPPLFLNGIYYFLDKEFRNISAFDSTKKDKYSRWLHFGDCHETTDEEDEDEEDEEEDDDDDEEEEDNDDDEEGDDDDDDDDDDEEEEDDDEEEEEEEEEEEDEEEEEEEEEDVADEEDDDDDKEEEDDEEEEEEEEDEEEEEEEEILDGYMVEVEGEIWGVFVSDEGGRVSVKKLDLCERRWSKLESLGDKCLYVSISGSFAETCVDTEQANKIYLDKFHGKSGVMYSLSSGMYHSIDGDFADRGAYGLSQVEHGAWIKPSC